MNELPTERIFYDGACGVCHWSVGFVARHDPDGRTFRFAPLHGESFVRDVAVEMRRDLPDSMVVLTADGSVLLRSAGLVHILCRLGSFWKLLGLLLVAVPRPFRDFVYDRFARVRHRLASQPEGVCPMMSAELRARFDP